MVQRSKSYLIDVHQHPLPPFYKALLDEVGISNLAGGATIWNWTPQDALAVMDEHGIAAGIGIITPWQLYSTNLARRFNEYFARVISDYPGRFGWCAWLHFPDLEGALKELEYSIDQLKLDGVCMLTNVQGHYVADPEYEELFAELNRRKMVVAFHPNAPTFRQSGSVGKVFLPIAGIEYPLETSRTVAQLAIGGTFERYPDIRFILPHGGGAIPYLAGRYFGARENGAKLLKLLKNQYYECTGCNSPPPLRAMQEFVEPSHIMWGTDYGGLGTREAKGVPRAVKALREYDGFDEKTRALVEHGNALELFPRLKAHLKG